MSISQNDMKIFGNLFVLEAANNHCGDVERGLKLIRDHAVVARQNNVRAAVKLQFRKMDTFVHPDFKGSVSSEEKSLYYIQKTEAKALTFEEYQILIN